jgi:hypothetical protein
VILNHSTRDFFVNLIFFYLLPIILVVKIVSFVRSQGFFQQLAGSSPGDQDVERGVPAAKQTPNARRIIPKNAPKMKAVPKLKANAPKLKGRSG